MVRRFAKVGRTAIRSRRFCGNAARSDSPFSMMHPPRFSGQFCRLRGRLLALDRRRAVLILEDRREIPFCNLRELESLEGELPD